MSRGNRISGVNWVGRVYEWGAWGDVTRNHILGLKQINYPIRVYPVGSIHYDVKMGVDHYIKPLLNVDVGPTPAVILDKGLDFVHQMKTDNMMKVGRVLFETDRIPASLAADCQLYDEIWVPSRFNFETFSRSGVAPDKLRVIPYAINTEIYKPRSGKYPIPDRRKFVFLAMLGFSWKKGFDLLLEAYLKEFTIKDDVTLVIKVLSGSDRPSDRHQAEKIMLGTVSDRVDLKSKDLAHYVFIDEKLSQEHLLDLYSTCDLYISTDRANGWGMAFMEAMAMGKPAATINYSGSTEFMNRANSLIIETTGRLVPVDPRFVAQAPIFAGHQWAEVEVKEVQRVMRYAYGHPVELKQIAESGMKDMHKNYSLEAVGKKVAAALSEISLSSKQERGRSKIRFKKAYGLKFRLRLFYHRLRYRCSNSKFLSLIRGSEK